MRIYARGLFGGRKAACSMFLFVAVLLIVVSCTPPLPISCVPGIHRRGVSDLTLRLRGGSGEGAKSEGRRDRIPRNVRGKGIDADQRPPGRSGRGFGLAGGSRGERAARGSQRTSWGQDEDGPKVLPPPQQWPPARFGFDDGGQPSKHEKPDNTGGVSNAQSAKPWRPPDVPAEEMSASSLHIHPSRMRRGAGMAMAEGERHRSERWGSRIGERGLPRGRAGVGDDVGYGGRDRWRESKGSFRIGPEGDARQKGGFGAGKPRREMAQGDLRRDDGRRRGRRAEQRSGRPMVDIGASAGGNEKSDACEDSDSDNWMNWSDGFDKCVDDELLAREAARDLDEEALAYQCTSELQRERRQVFLQRWREISAQECFVKGRFCPGADLWFEEAASKMDAYLPLDAPALKKCRDDALALLEDADAAARSRELRSGGEAVDVEGGDAAGLVTPHKLGTAMDASACDAEQRTADERAEDVFMSPGLSPRTPVMGEEERCRRVGGGGGEEGNNSASPVTPLTALKRRTEAYLAPISPELRLGIGDLDKEGWAGSGGEGEEGGEGGGEGGRGVREGEEVGREDEGKGGGEERGSSVSKADGGDEERKTVAEEFEERYRSAAAEWRDGPDWAKLDVSLLEMLDEIPDLEGIVHAGRSRSRSGRSELGPGLDGGADAASKGWLGSIVPSGDASEALDGFLVDRPSAFSDHSLSGFEMSMLTNATACGLEEQAGYVDADRHGIPLFYDTESHPTVLDIGSEVPPGVVRFLGSTLNGGWRNPAKHPERTGVRVLAAGKWWDQTYSNGTTVRVRGSPISAFDIVDAYVDEQRAEVEDDDWPAPRGTRLCQPGIGVTIEDVLEWAPKPAADYLAVHQGWFMLDIGRGRRVLPRAYCIRNGGSRFGCPISWVLHGAESRQGPWFALDARGIDWVNTTDNWEPLYKELAEGQKYVFPHDHVYGGWKEPEDGFVEPIPHHAAVWRVRNPDESGRGYRFFRLMQIRSRMYEERRMVIQGFEVYGALRMGLDEMHAEELVNPSGLTTEEEGLLEDHNELQVKNTLSWDPKVLMERERQREYKGPTYADKMSEAYREVEERLNKLTVDAINAGSASGEQRGAEGRGSDEEEEQEEEEDDFVVAPELPRIELVNLKMMEADELLHFVWGQEHVAHAILDVKRWAALPENSGNMPQVVAKWVQMTSAKSAKEAKLTCDLLGVLVDECVVDSSVIARAVADEELQDILRAENVVLLKHLNNLLAGLDLAPIAAVDRAAGAEGEGGGDGEDGGAGGDDDDEEALLAELAAMRGSGGNAPASDAWESGASGGPDETLRSTGHVDAGGMYGGGCEGEGAGGSEYSGGVSSKEPSSTEPSSSSGKPDDDKA